MASALLLMIVVAIIPLFVMAGDMSKNDYRKSVALAMAEKQINTVRSLPYDSIGLISGNPGGVIPPETSTVSDNITFTIKSRIRWIDDSADGIAPTDQDPRDYKQLVVEVSWMTLTGIKEISQVSNVARQSEQQISSNGNVIVSVRNTNGEVIEDASVLLTHSPLSSQTQYTDNKGEALFADLPPSVEDDDYEFYVTKSGYVVRPDQIEQYTTVIAGDTRVLEFIMAQPGALRITLKDEFGVTINKHCKLTLSNPYAGEKEFKFQENTGYFEINNLFPSNWGIVPFAPSYSYEGQPVVAVISPGVTQDIDIVMTARPAGNLHLEAYNSDTSAPISGANVTLTDLSTSETIVLQTNGIGILEEQLGQGSWRVYVEQDGFLPETVDTSISVGNNFLTVNLHPQPVAPGSIRVHAIKSDGSPRKNKKIRIIGGAEKYTDSNGYVIFSNLSEGQYTIEHKKGSSWRDPMVVDVTSGQQEQVEYQW